MKKRVIIAGVSLCLVALGLYICKRKKREDEEYYPENEDQIEEDPVRLEYGLVKPDLEELMNRYMPPDDDEDEEEDKPLEVNLYSSPTIVDEEEFDRERLDYYTITLLYYVQDDTLCLEEDDEIITDRKARIGEDALDSFGVGTTDPNRVFVINDQQKVKYEVIKVDDVYSKVDLLDYNYDIGREDFDED